MLLYSIRMHFSFLSLPFIVIFMGGCFSQSTPSSLRNSNSTAFCEISSRVFALDAKDFLTVACADINNDGWIDIFFNNHNKERFNFFINDGSTFSEINSKVGIREVPWVEDLFIRPHFNGNDYGYFIWRDPQYDWRWKIRWSSGATPHQFSGKICPAIKSFDHAWLDQFTMRDPVPVGSDVEATLDTSKCVVFRGSPSTDIQGIDVFINPEIGLNFDIKIDDMDQPQLVFVGGMKDSPPSIPFLLRTTDRHGCAWGDYDNDGYNDLYIVRGGIVGFLNSATDGKLDELYNNQKNGTFRNVYDAVGFSPNCIRGRGVQWVDIDNDGFLDLSIGGRGDKLSLFRNCNGIKFEKSALPDVFDINASYPNWSDINGDALPDLLLAGGVNGRDGIMLNKGNWHFEDITAKTGLADTEKLYAKYHRAIKEIGAGLSDGAMMFPADFDNDGNFDLFIGSPHGNAGKIRLLCNTGGLVFKDCTAPSGLPLNGPWREGQWADYDNDGFLDLLLLSSQPDLRTRLYRNAGNRKFDDVTETAGINLSHCEGALFFDYNNDGFLDLVAAGHQAVNQENDCPCERNVPIKAQGKKVTRLFKNLGNSNNWLKISLEGTKSNRNGFGTRILLQNGRIMQIRIAGDNGKGRYTQSVLPLHFGLGSSQKADYIEISWPSGSRQRLENVSCNQHIKIREP